MGVKPRHGPHPHRGIARVDAREGDDDRQDRLGVKLKDADLIGIPLQIIVGPKNLEEGNIEIKIRKTQESQLHPFPQAIKDIPNILKDL